MRTIWFKRKRYGWGWTPSTWQGWAIIAAYAAILIALATTVGPGANEAEAYFMIVLPMFILTAALIRISYKYGEYPRWRWGRTDDYSIVAFDLDGTLAESKMPLDPEMSLLLTELLRFKKVAIISGGAFPQLEKQVLAQLGSRADLRRLYLLPTNGATLLSYDKGWQTRYKNSLSVPEKSKIFEAFRRVPIETGYVRPERTYGTVVEDRDSQITFSALGSTAPVELKQAWDPDHKKREVLQAGIKKYLPEYSVSIGGMTSIDVTKGSIDKAYGIRRLLEYTRSEPEDLLFVGDALFPGGNDASVLSVGVKTAPVTAVSDTKKLIGTLFHKTV